jgi:NADH-quinone oxidoreductase subunit G
MEGASIGAPASLNARFWSPGWNSDQALSKFQAEVSGQLVGGDPGVRLFEPPEHASGSYFAPAAPAAAGRDGRLLLVPRYHVFGSEELSSLAPGIASRTAPASVALSRAEGEKRGLKEGDTVHVTVDGAEPAELVVLIREMPGGTASVQLGAPGTPALPLPAWAPVTASVRTGAAR